MADKSIFKNTIYKLLLDILRIIIPIVFVPYVYRILNPEIMGNIEFSQSISGYFFIFAGFGVYTYGLREISRVRENIVERNRLFTELFIISVISSILVTVIYIGYVFFKFNSDVILKNMLLINSIQLFSAIFYIEWINEAFENYKFISQKTIIIKIINLIFILFMVKTAEDYYKYLFLLNIFVLINNFISYIYIKRQLHFKFENICLRKYLIPLGAMLLISNVNILYTQLDKIALGFYSKELQEVAYYGVAQKVMTVLMVLIMAIIKVTIPRLSFLLGQNQKEEYEKMFNKIFPFIYALLFPIGIGIILLNKEIALFFGGEAYLPARLVLIVFGIRIIVVAVESLLSNQVIFLHQKEKIMIMIIGTCGVVNFIMKYLLIKFNYFNAATAIFTTMLAEILIIILDYWYIKKYLKLNLEIFNLKNLKYLIISLVFFPIGYFIKTLELSHIITSIITALVCALYYLIVLVLLRDPQIQEILKRLPIKKLKEKL